MVLISKKAQLNLTQEQEEDLTLITTFNILTRYSDEKLKFYKKCTVEYTKINIEKIKKMRSWLKEMI